MSTSRIEHKAALTFSSELPWVVFMGLNGNKIRKSLFRQDQLVALAFEHFRLLVITAMFFKIVEGSVGCLSLHRHFIKTSFAETMSLLYLSLHLSYRSCLVLAMNSSNANFCETIIMQKTAIKYFHKEAQFCMNTWSLLIWIAKLNCSHLAPRTTI